MKIRICPDCGEEFLGQLNDDGQLWQVVSVGSELDDTDMIPHECGREREENG